jgi:hypothetical protein
MLTLAERVFESAILYGHPVLGHQTQDRTNGQLQTWLELAVRASEPSTNITYCTHLNP